MLCYMQRISHEQEYIQIDRNFTSLIKFISCLMVAMSHYCGYALANGLSSNILYKLIAANGGYVGVALFFFLSGYGLMTSERLKHLSVAEFFKRRLIKTYVPAVVVSAIWLCFARFTNLSLLCNQRYLRGVFWVFNDEVLWFINSIILLYVAFRIYVFARQYIYKNQWLLLLILGCLTYIFLYVFNIGSTLSVPIFFIGVVVAQYGKFIRSFILNKKTLFIALVIYLILLYFFRHDNYLLHGWCNYFVITLFIWIICRWNITLPPMPKWIGACSYDLYLVHWKVHLAILYFCGVDRMWMFLLYTAIITIVFYNLRRLLRI